MIDCVRGPKQRFLFILSPLSLYRSKVKFEFFFLDPVPNLVKYPPTLSLNLVDLVGLHISRVVVLELLMLLFMRVAHVHEVHVDQLDTKANATTLRCVFLNQFIIGYIVALMGTNLLRERSLIL